jgi:hypothetical protein
MPRLRHKHWIDIQLPAPCAFVAATVKLAMMSAAAQRHREFVADFTGESAGLRKPQMVGIQRSAAARDTRLGTHELLMIPVPQP